MALATEGQIVRSVVHYEFVKIVWIVRLPIRIIAIHPLALIVFFLEYVAGPPKDGGLVVRLAGLGCYHPLIL